MKARTGMGMLLGLVLAGCPGNSNKLIHLPMAFGEKQRVTGRVVLVNNASKPVHVFARPSRGQAPVFAVTLNHDSGIAVPFVLEHMPMNTDEGSLPDVSFIPLDFIGPPLGSESDTGMVLVACEANEEPIELRFKDAAKQELYKKLFVDAWQPRGLGVPTAVIDIGICDDEEVPPRDVRLIGGCKDLGKGARSSLPECAN